MKLILHKDVRKESKGKTNKKKSETKQVKEKMARRTISQ